MESRRFYFKNTKELKRKQFVVASKNRVLLRLLVQGSYIGHLLDINFGSNIYQKVKQYVKWSTSRTASWNHDLTRNVLSFVETVQLIAAKMLKSVEVNAVVTYPRHVVFCVLSIPHRSGI